MLESKFQPYATTAAGQDMGRNVRAEPTWGRVLAHESSNGQSHEYAGRIIFIEIAGGG